MVELESEGELSRHEVAEFLRDFADEFDDGIGERAYGGDREDRPQADRERVTEDRSTDPIEGDRSAPDESASYDPERVTLIVGGDSATVTVPDVVDFDVEVESRSPMLKSGVSQQIDFELSWKIEDHDHELSGDQIDVQ